MSFNDEAETFYCLVRGGYLAYAIQQNLRHVAEGTVWDQGVFQLSRSGLDSLISVLGRSDFGAFVFSPDDIVKMRSKEAAVIRDNVLLELGLFIGRLGKERCFVMVPENTELHIASDLIGMTPATYETSRSDGNVLAGCGPACNDIRTTIQRLGVFPGNVGTRDGAPQKGKDDTGEAEPTVEKRESWTDAFFAKEYDKAVALLEREIELATEDTAKADYRGVIGMIEFTRDPVKGVASFEASIKRHPKNTGLYSIFANSNLWQDRFEECLAVVERGLAAGAGRAELGDIKVRCLAKMGNREAAIAVLEEEVTKSPAATLYSSIADYYEHTKEVDKVLAAVIRGLRFFPKDEGLLLRYGRLLQASSNFAGAVRIYQQLVIINEKNPTYRALLGNAYLSLNLNGLALEAYRHADGLAKGKEGWIIANIGNLMNNTGLYPEAVKYLEDSLKLTPDSPYSHERMASALASKQAENERLEKVLSEAPPLFTLPASGKVGKEQKPVVSPVLQQ